MQYRRWKQDGKTETKTTVCRVIQDQKEWPITSVATICIMHSADLYKLYFKTNTFAWLADHTPLEQHQIY